MMTATAAATLVALASACGGINQSGPAASADQNDANGSLRCAVVLDASASVPAELRPRQLTEAAEAVRGCVGGRVSVDVADANARAGRCAPVDLPLVAPSPRGNAVFDDAARDQQVELALAATDELFTCATTQPASATDLFGALVVAGASLHSEPAGRRVLTVVSDGVSTRAPYDLSARELDDADVERLLTDLAGDGLLADLTDVDVRFVGAGVGVDELDPSRLARLEVAWREYVTAAGGTVSFYGKTLGGTR